MRIQELIGRNVRQAREEEGLSQRELGERVEGVLGRTLFGQAVSAAERGEREWTAADLVAVAWVLHRSVSWFFKVPDGVSEWEVLDVDGDESIHLAWVSGEQTANRTPDAIATEMRRLASELQTLTGTTFQQAPTFPTGTISKDEEE